MTDNEKDDIYKPLETEETEPLDLETMQLVKTEGIIPQRHDSFSIEGGELTLKSEDDEVAVCLEEGYCIPIGSGDEVYNSVKVLLKGLEKKGQREWDAELES